MLYYPKEKIMLTTIESVKRAARKGKKATLAGLNESDKRKVLKMAGFPTSSGTMYVPLHLMGKNST